MRWSAQNLPVILQLETGELLLIEALDADGLATYWLSNGGDLVREEPLETLLTRVKPEAVMLGIAARGRDSRVDEFTQPWKRTGSGSTFTQGVTVRDCAGVRRWQRTAGGILFLMQVYDRVILLSPSRRCGCCFSAYCLPPRLNTFIRLARTHVSDIISATY
jgi:ATP-binding cassette subfamily C protein LapB